MKTLTPDPVGQHADQLQPQIDAAIEKGDVNEVVNLSVRATYLTALAICRDAGIPPPRPAVQTQLSLFLAFRDACDAHLERGDDDRVSFAREAFDAIATVEAELRARKPASTGANGDTARLLLLGARLGQADVMLELVRTGRWKEFQEALRSLHDRGAHLRGRVPTWEEAFMPVAQAFCVGKEKVSLGRLVVEARNWADAERAARRNPGLPISEDGIKAGLKRMEKRGLSIPGR